MKKLPAALAVALCVCMSTCFAETITLSAGTYIVGEGDVAPGVYTITTEDATMKAFLSKGTELNVTGELALEAAEDVRFRVDSGEYIAGEEFPAGTYSIDKLAIEEYPMIMVYDTEGKMVLAEVLYRDKDLRIGKIDLLDGYKVKVDGRVMFSPAVGITFE